MFIASLRATPCARVRPVAGASLGAYVPVDP